MKKNTLRERLDAGKPTVGTRMVSVSPQIVEIIGLSGAFDYIELSGEYAAWGLSDLENFARAVELFPQMSSMMKVEQEPRAFITSRSLGAGIQNLIFSDCHSAEEVRECVRAVKPATPEDGGIHGCAVRRSAGYFIDVGNEAWVKAQRDAVIAVMIEKASAIEQLDDIMEVEGVDIFQFGPCDYSLSVGKTGKMRSPEIMKVQQEMIERVLKKGKQARVELNGYEGAKEFIEMGVRHFCIGFDLAVLYQWSQQQGKGMREALGKS